MTSMITSRGSMIDLMRADKGRLLDNGLFELIAFDSETPVESAVATTEILEPKPFLISNSKSVPN